MLIGGRHFKNFGDCLQPYILKHYGLTPYFVTSNQKTDVVLAGSILQWVPSDYSGFIIGTGAEKGDYSFDKASIWALRGKLTYQHVKPQPTHCVFGDIGLLMPFVFNEKVETKYDLGIVPHFKDYQNVLFTRLRSWGRVKIINVRQSPKVVIREIRECRHIAASSLHGLIIAEAYGIPTVRVVSYETFVWKNPDYKYEDHYSALGVTMHTHIMDGRETKESLIAETTLKPMDVIQNIQSDLDRTMRDFARVMKKRQRKS